MADLLLNIGKNLSGIGVVPAPVQLLGRNTKLDNEIGGQVLRLDLATLLPPQPGQRPLISPHNDASVGSANEIAAMEAIGLLPETDRFFAHIAPCYYLIV